MNLEHGSQGHLVSKTKSSGSLGRHGSRTEFMKLLAGPKKETHGSRTQGRGCGDLLLPSLPGVQLPPAVFTTAAPCTGYMAEACGQSLAR